VVCECDVRCNAASSKIDLYGIYSQVSTECPGSYYVSKYQIGNTSGVNVSIKQGGDSFYQHQISSWTFGVPPPTLRNYLTAQDSSSPGCLYVGGIIQKGFCTTSSGVSAKYFGSVCAGKKTQAGAYSWDFVVSTEELTYKKCFEYLDTSPFESHCGEVSGRYGFSYSLRQRRALLPDCCEGYIRSDTAVRSRCDCQNLFQEPECSDICCCSLALQNLASDSRCPALQTFINHTSQIEEYAHRDCCTRRLISQCQQDSDCANSTNPPVDFINELNIFPLCCSYCMDIYNTMCSFQSIGVAGPWTYSVKDSNNDGLLNLCISMGCRNDYPCSYTGKGAQGANAVREVIIVLITALLIFVFWPCIHPVGKYCLDVFLKWIREEV